MPERKKKRDVPNPNDPKYDKFWNQIAKMEGDHKRLLPVVGADGIQEFVETYNVFHGYIAGTQVYCCDSATDGGHGSILYGRETCAKVVELLDRHAEAGSDLMCAQSMGSAESMGYVMGRLDDLLISKKGPTWYSLEPLSDYVKLFGDSPETRALWDRYVRPRVETEDAYVESVLDHHEDEEKARECWRHKYAPDLGVEVPMRTFVVEVPIEATMRVEVKSTSVRGAQDKARAAAKEVALNQAGALALDGIEDLEVGGSEWDTWRYDVEEIKG